MQMKEFSTNQEGLPCKLLPFYPWLSKNPPFETRSFLTKARSRNPYIFQQWRLDESLFTSHTSINNATNPIFSFLLPAVQWAIKNACTLYGGASLNIDIWGKKNYMFNLRNKYSHSLMKNNNKIVHRALAFYFLLGQTDSAEIVHTSFDVKV